MKSQSKFQSLSVQSSSAKNTGYDFGTFSGVFTPCTLTIFGVIMYLRTGYVVGHAGIGGALLILLLAKTITILTTLSLSAVATNQKIKGGGAYFLISRSLGSEFGGSIGLALYLAQAISVTLYIVGFTEALTSTFPLLTDYTTMIGLIVCLILFIVTYIGASWAVKIQFLILILLLLSIASFLVGGPLGDTVTTETLGVEKLEAGAVIPPADSDGRLARQLKENWHPRLDAPNDNFWLVFAVYFPAVTGIMVGASMSGDLKDPQKSIPAGTLYSIGFTLVVYALQILVVGTAVQMSVLRTESLALPMLKSLSLFPPLVDLGIWVATLSSALGSFVGAPRVLQALAMDRIFPSISYFKRGEGANNEPRRAVILTFMIAAVGIYLGNLNLIAPIITMFFLLTYGVINFACFYESKSNNPSFRPRFQFYHWLVALVASVACAAVMLLIHPGAALISFALFAVVYFYIRKKQIITAWGDPRRGYLFQRITETLLKMQQLKYHPRNWRPQILVMTGNVNYRSHLVDLAYRLESRRGFLILASILTGSDLTELFKRRLEKTLELENYCHEENIPAFAEVVAAENLMSGMLGLLQSSGVGRYKPNSLLMGWCETESMFACYFENIRRGLLNRMDIMLYRHREGVLKKAHQIDIWWRGWGNGNLMVSLGYLLTLNPDWCNCSLRVLQLISSTSEQQNSTEKLSELLNDARVTAEIKVVVSTDNLADVLARESSQSELVFLGMNPPSTGEELQFVEKMNSIMAKLGNVLLVKGSGQTDLRA